MLVRELLGHAACSFLDISSRKFNRTFAQMVARVSHRVLRVRLFLAIRILFHLSMDSA
jgi:hypothetical protein